MQNGNEKKKNNLNQDSKLKKKQNKAKIKVLFSWLKCKRAQGILGCYVLALNSFRCAFCAFTLFVAFFFVYLYLAIGY